ncbi:MAG: GAF domain-containing protein, partial [Pseudomonadota bacterium]|nr:GAF domain-containing protein [Pseudomonadota bacterium]
MAQRAEAAAGSRRRLGRVSLAAKLSVAFLGLVAFVLIVNGAVDSYLTYDQAKRAALEVESEKARAAAERVGVFLDEIQTELGWTAGVEWGYAKPEQQRYDFIRLLRQAPAITALAYLDGKGKEQLAVSRLEPDAVGSGRDFSADPRFVRAVADKIWFGPVEFRRGSEPYMTVALAHVGKPPGVTVADVNLKLIWDVVSAIHVGDKGFAYVVDGAGRLIAHPDLSLVLRDTDLSALPQVAAALAGRGASEAEVARWLDGASVLTAHAVAPRTHWTVFVEQPLAEALATAYRSLLRSLALLGLGLTLAAVSGVALARRMAAPIRLLQAGAEKLGSGDLAQRLDIRTGDEIEALAGGFNRMAERLQESYENLEAKVEARTRDLNEALAQQTATADVLKVISRSAFGLKTVLQTLVDSAVRLCANDGVIYLRDGDVFRAAAAFAAEVAGQDSRNRSPRRPGRDSITGRVALSGRVEQIPDNEADPEFQVAPAQRMNMRALLGVPLLRDGEIEGVFVLGKPEPGLFSDRAVELVRTFADQAVIAIQNVRLFEAVQAKTRDVEQALERQTATSEILRVIAGAPGDADKALQFIAETCARLFAAPSVSIQLAEGVEFVREFRVGAIAQRIGSAYPRSIIKVGGRNLPGAVVA